VNAARKVLSLVYAWQLYIGGDSVSTGMQAIADMHVRIPMGVCVAPCDWYDVRSR